MRHTIRRGVRIGRRAPPTPFHPTQQMTHGIGRARERGKGRGREAERDGEWDGGGSRKRKGERKGEREIERGSKASFFF